MERTDMSWNKDNRQRVRGGILANIDNVQKKLKKLVEWTGELVEDTAGDDWTSSERERELTVAAVKRLDEAVKGALRATEDPQFEKVDGVL